MRGSGLLGLLLLGTRRSFALEGGLGGSRLQRKFELLLPGIGWQWGSLNEKRSSGALLGRHHILWGAESLLWREALVDLVCRGSLNCFFLVLLVGGPVGIESEEQPQLRYQYYQFRSEQEECLQVR